MNVRYLADVPEVVYVSRFYGPDGQLVDESTSKGNPRKTGDVSTWTFGTDKLSKVQNNIGIWRLELYLGTNLMFIEYFSVGVYLFDVSVTGLSSNVATKVFVDGKEAGSIRGGERKPSALAIGTHTISVSSLVEVSSDLRYTCDKNSCTVSSEGSYTFEYLVAGTTQTATTTKTETMTVQTKTTTKIISGLDRAMGVEVNPNTELLSIVLSMTSWGQRFPPVRVILGYKYQDEIEQYFSKFKIHPAVTIAQQLTDSGFTYDAPVNFVLHFGPPPKMEKLYPYDDYLVGRARGASILDSFADALRGFAEASRFMDFYNSHADLYNSILSAYKDLDMRTLVYTLERFYGDQKRGYQIIVGASMPRAGGGYGATIQTDKGDICYFVYRASSPLYSTASLYSLGLHEFAHSFVNPMVAQFRGDVDRLRYLLDPVSRQMSDMAYGTFETMLDETIIRAFEALQSTMEFGPSTGTYRIMSEMRQGFYFVDTVYNHLVEYLYNIDSYKTFASYLPKIFAEIGKITPQEAQKKASESLSSPSPSLKSAPIPAVTISLVVKSPSLTIDDSSNVRLEMRNTGAIDIYARTVVSITQNLGLLNETVYGIILRRNETQSLNLAIKGIGPIGAASLGARVFYSSRLLDDKTCRIEITSPRATTTETTATRALLPDASLLIIVGGGVVVAIGSFIALRKRRKTAPLARAN
jgi:hypothetical protein